MNKRYAPTDPKTRRRVFIAVGAVFAALALFRRLAWPLIEQALLRLDSARALSLLTNALLLTVLLLIPPGILLMGAGVRTLRGGRFPPAGAWLIKNSVIHFGRPARMIAAGLIGAGLVLIGLSIAAALAVYDAFLLPGFFASP